MNPLLQLQDLGQAVWIDSIRRCWLAPGGYLHRLVDKRELNGLTSNPTIFEQALAADASYQAQLADLQGEDPRAAFWSLMKADVQRACDVFLPSGGTQAAHGRNRLPGLILVVCQHTPAGRHYRSGLDSPFLCRISERYNHLFDRLLRNLHAGDHAVCVCTRKCG